MVSLLGQTWTAFRDAKVAIEYRCRLLKSAIMQSTEGRRLRMTLRRRWQGVRSRTGDLQHFVRNNMARFKETEEPHASTPTPTPSLPVSAPRHQPMQDTTRSMSYMNMLLPCQPLLPVWSMEEKGKGGEKRGQGSRAQVESEGNVVALQKPFTSEALEDYLVRTIQSRSLEAQLTSIPRQEAGLSQEVSKRGCNSKKNRYKNNIPWLGRGEQRAVASSGIVDGRRRDAVPVRCRALLEAAEGSRTQREAAGARSSPRRQEAGLGRRVACDDDTRVVLEGEGDYINASYIEASNYLISRHNSLGISGPRHFIATQGPKETNDRTLDDFWRMVWQNKTNVIVMLGNLIEGGRGKVSQYWPDSGEDRYGEVMVQKMSERSCFDHIRRHFIVAKGADSRELLHYQYFGWPDHDVPGSPVGAANMIKDVTRWHWSGPPVIHCSAGLGRTGTFLLVLCVLDELRTKGVFHPLNTLRGIRRCRANVLDNVNQYRFAQHVLLEILFGERTRSYLHKFPAYMSFNRNHLASQYKELKSYPKNLTYDWARSHDPIMNRDNSVLPPDGRHIILKMNDLINDKYMNMVRVRGANLRDTFLVTEHPMAHTVARVWRIAYMAQVSVWIFIHEYEPNDEAREAGRVRSGRVGSGRVGTGWVRSGRVGLRGVDRHIAMIMVHSASFLRSFLLRIVVVPHTVFLNRERLHCLAAQLLASDWARQALLCGQQFQCARGLFPVTGTARPASVDGALASSSPLPRAAFKV
ncbi:Receptor-type tyrosine-protein phosphatase T [Chionoecetes opilio]|uniref:protein-tyrosine-phosphatase n=1 Tax=Chionoecetes opilio TaxID=41210 RepID=A0A8J5BZ43_CHIOP|nr:Receptor-type tyrosine-protein phosphatase T [Chionoecetes opilio]